MVHSDECECDAQYYKHVQANGEIMQLEFLPFLTFQLYSVTHHITDTTDKGYKKGLCQNFSKNDEKWTNH